MRPIDLSTWPEADNGLLRESDKRIETDRAARIRLRFRPFVRLKVR
jgi:hypothetical protein